MKSIKSFGGLIGLLLFLGFVYNCSDDHEQDLETSGFTLEQAKTFFSGLKENVKLVNFDRTFNSQDDVTNLPEVFPEWSSARLTEMEGGYVWEIPVLKKYGTVIVAGKLSGNFIRPFEQAVDYRLLIDKNERTGEITCRMLTLIGKNIAHTKVNCLENLSGFAIISDRNGNPQNSYQILNGNLNNIIAGNAKLQNQENEFYCFCFREKVDNVLLTKANVADSTSDSLCIYCMKLLEDCICNRCPDCRNTVGYCVCPFCHICGKPHPECLCNVTCSGCQKPSWQCECVIPPESSEPSPPSLPLCPMCDTYHEGVCMGTSPTPLCKYGNIYCEGGEKCRCCPDCHNYPCNCFPSMTTY